jgi:hypothetical protein
VLDRSLFAEQITAAWEALKTPERRSAHDARANAGRAAWPDATGLAWPAEAYDPPAPVRALARVEALRKPARKPSLWKRFKTLFRRRRR